MMRLNYIDFAKGYAMLAILIFHGLNSLELPSVVAKVSAFGGAGVHLFIFLSGFGLGYSNKELSLAGFYQRRLVKIWVPYVLALTLSMWAAFAWNIFPDRWEAWLAGVGLYQMFSGRWIETLGGHFWFISTIIQFYLIYPLLVRFQKKSHSSAAFLIGCLLASMAWWIAISLLGKAELRHWNSFFLQFLWEFALGMSIAKWHKAGRGALIVENWWRADRWWAWTGLGIVACGVMLGIVLAFGPIGRVFNDVPAFIGFTSLSVAVYLIGGFPRSLFQWLGTFSFSLYLIHILILEMLSGGLGHYGIKFSLIWMPAFIGAALLAGIVFEKFSMRVQGMLRV